MTMNEVLLRGCTIKNSGNVHGVVIYTGPESRIQMNAARPPKKTGVLSPYAPSPQSCIRNEQCVFAHSNAWEGGIFERSSTPCNRQQG